LLLKDLELIIEYGLGYPHADILKIFIYFKWKERSFKSNHKTEMNKSE
jgi:hypothetical protein